MLNSLLSWERLFPDFTEEKVGLSSGHRLTHSLTPRGPVGFEPQAPSKAWRFPTTSLGVWETKKGLFPPPNRCQKSLSWAMQMRNLWNSQAQSLYHFLESASHPSLSRDKKLLQIEWNGSPAEAQVRDLGPCCPGSQTPGTTPKSSGKAATHTLVLLPRPRVQALLIHFKKLRFPQQHEEGLVPSTRATCVCYDSSCCLQPPQKKRERNRVLTQPGDSGSHAVPGLPLLVTH